MKLEQIAQVIELASTGSFNKTAQNLYMSQPNLSKSIRQLEEEMEVELFTRTPQGVIPTPACRDFLSYANSIQHDLQLLQNLSASSGLKPRINFSVVMKWLKWVGDIFAELVLRYENQPIHFSLHRVDDIETQFRMVAANQAELGIIVLPERDRKSALRQIKSNNLEYHPIISGHSGIVLGVKNPLYQKNITEVEPEMLKDLPLIFVNESHQSDFFRIIDIPSTANNTVNSIIHVGDSSTMYRIIAKTTAITLSQHISAFYSDRPYYEGVHFLPFKDNQYTFEIGWIKQQRNPLSDIAREFLDEIYATIKLS